MTGQTASTATSYPNAGPTQYGRVGVIQRRGGEDREREGEDVQSQSLCWGMSCPLLSPSRLISLIIPHTPSQGMEPSLRKEAWRYLLNYFPFDSSDIDRMELQKVWSILRSVRTHCIILVHVCVWQRKEKEYWSMKGQWQRFTPDQERRFSKWREVKTLISQYCLPLSFPLSLSLSLPLSPSLFSLPLSPSLSPSLPSVNTFFPDKDVLRTDRDVEMFSDKDSHRCACL